MGCSIAAAVCMLMLRQSWRTWERRGKGQIPPTHKHTHTSLNQPFHTSAASESSLDKYCVSFFVVVVEGIKGFGAAVFPDH